MLDFDKRFEEKMPDAATYPGIYAVWAYNNQKDNPVWALLDIGQAKNMSDRFSMHERKQLWQKYVENHEMKLVIYTAEIGNEHNYRDIAEAALLYKFQPICPTNGKEGYHHEDAKICVIGHLKDVFGEFSVFNTDK
ncbi:MAG: hypothetical protein IJS08_06785 [Victivallales bacterium]|nr:hypothetical protein [Victivallales bacterium]